VDEPSYEIHLEPDADGGFVAVIPAFPGCYSQGETEAETLANAHAAIMLTVEDMGACGEPVPRGIDSQRPE
jgi:predicted RNase H-like HicB family nuclease